MNIRTRILHSVYPACRQESSSRCWPSPPFAAEDLHLVANAPTQVSQVDFCLSAAVGYTLHIDLLRVDTSPTDALDMLQSDRLPHWRGLVQIYPARHASCNFANSTRARNRVLCTVYFDTAVLMYCKDVTEGRNNCSIKTTHTFTMYCNSFLNGTAVLTALTAACQRVDAIAIASAGDRKLPVGTTHCAWVRCI